MEKKVTIQDIADSLGLSRNTVSKALNNTGILAEETRQKILTRAAEMDTGDSYTCSRASRNIMLLPANWR